MTGQKLNRISYDGETLERVESAQPSWYRNLPGQMIGRSVELIAPRRPPALEGASGLWADPGRNPNPSDETLVFSWNGRTSAPLPVTFTAQCNWANEPVSGVDLFTAFDPVPMASLMAGINARNPDGTPVIVPASPSSPEINFNPSPLDGGFFRVTYGVGGTQHEMRLDLRDQAVDLPSCSWVRVSAARYPGGASRTPVNIIFTRRLPIVVSCALHAGSQEANADPIYSLGKFRTATEGIEVRYQLWPIANASEFLYGLSEGTSAGVVSVEGCVQTRSELVSVGTGTSNFPFWGPGLPLVPTSYSSFGLPFILMTAASFPAEQHIIYAGFRIRT